MPPGLSRSATPPRHLCSAAARRRFGFGYCGGPPPSPYRRHLAGLALPPLQSQIPPSLRPALPTLKFQIFNRAFFSAAHAEDLPLAGWTHRAALGGRRVPDHREKLSPDPGLSRPLDADSSVEPDRRRESGELDGAGGIKCITPPPTFNGIRGTLCSSTVFPL